jgi:hypothetical protein
MDYMLFKVILSVLSGAASVGVYLLIGISKNVQDIDKKVSGMVVKQDHLEKTTEMQTKEIKELQKAIR